MKSQTAATAALALTAALTLAGCSTGSDDDSMPGKDHGSSEQAPETVQADVNDADVTFASLMIVHHEQAIEMSDIILAKNNADPEVVELAEAIKSAQGPEIEHLQGWLEDRGVDSDGHQMGGMDHGDGMMSEDNLTALETADGTEASRLFLEQMIIHHKGAVAMAQTQVDDGSNPDAVDLAQTIEIQQMRDLLAAY